MTITLLKTRLTKTRYLIIVEETVVGELANSIDMYNEWGQKLKGPVVEDPTVYEATLYSSSLDKTEESINETDDADESNMDLFDDNPNRDYDAARYGVFMHNKSTATPNSTYLSPTVTSSSLDFIHTLLDETPANELMDFMSHPVYTNTQTTSVVHNPEGNPELTSYISGTSEVPLGTHIDVLATKTLLQEMFPDENAHHLSSLPETKMCYPTTYPQTNSLQAKEKKLMQKVKKNMRKINFKKVVAQKFREYDQKLEALTNFNVSKAFEKVLLKRIHSNKLNETHTTHQQLYDTLYESITLDQDTLDAQATQSSFHIRSHDNQDPPNNHEGQNKKKRQKDVDIDKDENHILGPSTISIAKKFKELIQKDNLTIADLEGTRLKQLKVQYNNDMELEYHVSQLKAAVLLEAQWNSDEGDVSKPRSIEERYTTSITKHYAARYYKEGIEDRIPKRWSKEVRRYHFEALNVRRSDDKEYEISYADLPRLNVNDVEDMYLLQKNCDQEHIQLGVESYQRTLNLTKPTMFFEGIDQRIPLTMTATHKGVENLIDMMLKNKLGSDNKRLKGRDWTDYDVKSSKETLKKIDKILRYREQLRWLEEYVGGRPKTVNPCTFVRPL
ncbi:hypothetical protein Tco_0749243 [Tanacetum coccineum]|uniref:Uncharacterized protein n=1 Tax=Tanacetum coccineum TaxID=301880 RepID=A0ABQ4Z0M4_9ASTR